MKGKAKCLIVSIFIIFLLMSIQGCAATYHCSNHNKDGVQKISGAEIKSILKEAWPGINSNNIKISDTWYMMPSDNELWKLVMDSGVNSFVHTYHILDDYSQMFDCDDFALLLHSFVIKERYNQMIEQKLSKEECLPWAFGQVWCKGPNSENHALNICITKDRGIQLIHPQTNVIQQIKRCCPEISFVRI
ncbi:MAG: hypothetical protein C4B58_12140 [Deltaproteobacteria bacterium]|nr:MAG: hypothetical protein C4B58_12140 [Deltaproteobacteria bacterium]